MEIEKELELKSYLSEQYRMNILNILPVKNVIKLSTSEGDKCLKRVRYGKGNFLFILSAMKHLQDREFNGIIPFIPTVSGEMYIALENGFGFLTDWISSRECDYSNPIELKMAARSLAKLHKASENYIEAEGAAPRIEWGRWIQKFTGRIQEMHKFKEIINNKPSLTYFDCMYLDNLDYYISQGILAVNHLKESRYLELSQIEMKKKSFCHHDYAHHNVLISDDFNVYIIDFDYCICDTRIHDLASLIIRNMRHGNWNIEKAQYIIECYLSEGYLEKDEIPVMNGFIEFPQDFWQVGLQYYIEKQKWDESQFNKRLDNVIKDRLDRQQFIDEFKLRVEL